ncbi:MAG: hypothetical protein WBI14_01265 [Anaerolineaceae bacterium]
MSDLISWIKEALHIDYPSPLDAVGIHDPYHVRPEVLREQEESVHASLALAETDNTLLVGARSAYELPHDRIAFDREAVMSDCMDAWRFNPLARRIVELTSQYVVGGGMNPVCTHAETQAFLNRFWHHRLNHLPVRLIEMSDELVRSGNLFVLLSTDPGGMSYLRLVPSADVSEIHSRANDVEQELEYHLKPSLEGEEKRYIAYDACCDGVNSRGEFATVMLHYAVNRPAGAQWGESDLGPVLKWLSRYSSWLEDRVRLNRFRNAFIYVVKAHFANESARQVRQTQLLSAPPSPGSVLVTDESEEWSVLSPKLEALDASTDGLAIKKMIAAGVGVPLHFLAEPESSTRTTAEAAGGPTFRRFEQRQRFIQWMLADLCQIVVARRAQVDRMVLSPVEIAIQAADISSKDNPSLAQAGREVAEFAADLLEKQLISNEEYLRLVYLFIDEPLPVGSGDASL